MLSKNWRLLFYVLGRDYRGNYKNKRFLKQLRLHSLRWYWPLI
jgi:hypothetical protein